MTKSQQPSSGHLWKVGALLLGASLLAGCSTENKFIRDGLNAPNNKEAEKVAEPNPIMDGPGLFTGKSGEKEIFSQGSEEDIGDPNKPRRVERRRR